MYDARHIANWFVRRAAKDERKLSIMALLKLTYIAHGWHLEMWKSPLIKNRIEAWQRGPVIPDVYHDFRSQGVEVSRPLDIPEGEMPDFHEKFLEDIYGIYGNLDAFRLSDMTHEPGSPWEKASSRGHYALMFDDEIREHYEQKRLRASA